MRDLFRLRNGTDIRGTAIAVDGDPVTLLDDDVVAIAKGFCLWVAKKTGRKTPTIAVGHDSRVSADRLSALVSQGIRAYGGNVVLTGLSTTPSMFMLLQENFGAQASIMITASHLPFQKNGLKFFLPEGGLEEQELLEVLTLASREDVPESNKAGVETEKSYMEKYAADLVQKVRTACGEEQPLYGKRIVVDAGNGAGGFFVDLVLKPLGAETDGSQFLDPDGTFPNHIPNPEDKDAMRSVGDAVRSYNADFGIIFDTDVDRAAAVAPNGQEINRNRLIALISAILLEEEKGAYIVTDSVTSDGLREFIKKHGGTQHRFKRGYKNVINECKRLNAEGKNSPLAIETSGHAALRENYYLDDGAYLITRLLIALANCAKKGKNLLDLISDLETPVEEAEIRLAFGKAVDFKTLGTQLIEDLKKEAIDSVSVTLAPDNYEGVRLNFDEHGGDGWALVRLSLHEPILPINAESNTRGGVNLMIKWLYEFFKKYSFLKLDIIKNYLGKEN